MKGTINVECMPEEPRAFFGAPDVAPLQHAVRDQVKTQVQKAATALDPVAMMKTLFPVNSEGFADLQKAFWSQFMGTDPSKTTK